MSALDDLPALHFDGVVLANELLDNLAFDVVERTAAGWSEVRVGLAAGELTEILVPAAAELAAWVESVDAPIGTRLPIATGALDWIVGAARLLRRGALILVDYVAPWSELVARRGGWLRTYAGHTRGANPLHAPGSQDITADVPVEMIRRAVARTGLQVVSEISQADWLAELGVAALVEDGRRRWEAGVAAPDLDAIAGRSRAVEAAALTDPAGLGAHTVVVAATR